MTDKYGQKAIARLLIGSWWLFFMDFFELVRCVWDLIGIWQKNRYKIAAFKAFFPKNQCFFRYGVRLWLRHSLLTRLHLRRAIAIPFLTNPATPAKQDLIRTTSGLGLFCFSAIASKAQKALDMSRGMLGCFCRKANENPVPQSRGYGVFVSPVFAL